MKNNFTLTFLLLATFSFSQVDIEATTTNYCSESNKGSISVTLSSLDLAIVANSVAIPYFKKFFIF